jgi:hypothetical protein
MSVDIPLPSKAAPSNPKGGSKPKGPPLPLDANLSVFDIQNIFRCRWFLSRANLLANAISAQKAEDRKFSWVKFTPHFHSHLVKCAVALVPRPLIKVKKVMFVYILELLDGEGNTTFFNLKSGGRKANNAQQEKKRLARKRCHAAKRERECEAAKVASSPPRMQQCQACGRKFASRKTARKHKCKDSKVVHVPPVAVGGQVSHPKPLIIVVKPCALLTANIPTDPVAAYFARNIAKVSHSHTMPVVTGDLRETIHVKVIKVEAPSPLLPPLPASPELEVLGIERTGSQGKRTRPPSPTRPSWMKKWKEE